jgi:hypothetical protein
VRGHDGHVEDATAWPRSWVGTWVAPDGKTISISWDSHGITVTARPSRGQTPYQSVDLLDGDTKMIENLPARCDLDQQGHRYLEVEAGTADLGPTYHLYPATKTRTGLRAAGDNVTVEKLLLVPNTVIGLYDDDEDDLGVPWAYPLHPLKWSSP